MKKIIYLILFSFTFLFANPSQTTCNEATGPGGNAFIPTKSTAEWLNFINHPKFNTYSSGNGCDSQVNLNGLSSSGLTWSNKKNTSEILGLTCATSQGTLVSNKKFNKSANTNGLFNYSLSVNPKLGFGCRLNSVESTSGNIEQFTKKCFWGLGSIVGTSSGCVKGGTFLMTRQELKTPGVSFGCTSRAYLDNRGYQQFSATNHTKYTLTSRQVPCRVTCYGTTPAPSCSPCPTACGSLGTTAYTTSGKTTYTAPDWNKWCEDPPTVAPIRSCPACPQRPACQSQAGGGDDSSPGGGGSTVTDGSGNAVTDGSGNNVESTGPGNDNNDPGSTGGNWN